MGILDDKASTKLWSDLFAKFLDVVRAFRQDDHPTLASLTQRFFSAAVVLKREVVTDTRICILGNVRDARFLFESSDYGYDFDFNFVRNRQIIVRLRVAFENPLDAQNRIARFGRRNRSIYFGSCWVWQYWHRWLDTRFHYSEF